MIPSLQQSGHAVISLDDANLHKDHFQSTYAALTAAEAPNNEASGVADQLISPEADSAITTGYHNLGGLSKYNANRAGIVMSNGELVSLASQPTLQDDLTAFRKEGCNIARRVYSAIEGHLDLPPNYFKTTFGELESSCQWHVKRYTIRASEASDVGATTQ